MRGSDFPYGDYQLKTSYASTKYVKYSDVQYVEPEQVNKVTPTVDDYVCNSYSYNISSITYSSYYTRASSYQITVSYAVTGTWSFNGQCTLYSITETNKSDKYTKNFGSISLNNSGSLQGLTLKLALSLSSLMKQGEYPSINLNIPSYYYDKWDKYHESSSYFDLGFSDGSNYNSSTNLQLISYVYFYDNITNLSIYGSTYDLIRCNTNVTFNVADAQTRVNELCRDNYRYARLDSAELEELLSFFTFTIN